MSINIFEEYWLRLKKPWCVAFALYLIVVVIVFGGFGVILSVFSGNFESDQKLLHVASNLSTFSVALLVPAIISILLSFLQLQNKVSAILLCILSLFISGTLLYFSHYTNGKIALGLSIVNAFLALFYWIVANHDNELLNDASYAQMITTETNKKHGTNW